MNYEDLVTKLWTDNVLFSVLIELTYSCNLDCFFCYNDRGLQGSPLNKGQYYSLLKELQEMQVLNVTLSGGEPLAHPDFFAIGGKARDLGFVVRIKSNGHALHREMAERIKNEIDPFMIDISLHGATAETHDRQTRVPGSFDRLMNNIRVMQDLNLRFRINSALTAWNEHEIEEMFELVNKWGAAFTLTPEITQRDNGDKTPLSLMASEAGIKKGVTISHRLARQAALESGNSTKATEIIGHEPTKQCGTGSSTLTIDPVGNILPCVQWRRPVGNLHNTSIKAIWRNSTDLEDIRNTAVEAKLFVEGLEAEAKQNGFCIGQSVAYTGSPVQTYSVALSQLLKNRDDLPHSMKATPRES